MYINPLRGDVCSGYASQTRSLFAITGFEDQVRGTICKAEDLVVQQIFRVLIQRCSGNNLCSNSEMVRRTLKGFKYDAFLTHDWGKSTLVAQVTRLLSVKLILSRGSHPENPDCWLI